MMRLPGLLQRVRPGEDFVRLEELVDCACLIVSGVAGRFGQAKDGIRLTTALHIPGDMADLHSVVLPKAASALMALGEAQIYRVRHSIIKEVGDRYPALARAFWRDCTVDAAILSQWALTNARQQGAGRIAHLLAEMSLRFNIGSPVEQRDYDFPLTQLQIGEATNLTPVHVNRMLRQLREMGLVDVRAKRVRILDWEGLCRCADFDPVYLHLCRTE